LHDVWPSPGLVHCMYTSGTLALYRNFAGCKIHFASKSSVLLHWQRYCTALEQWASAKVCDGMELRNFRRGRHLYWAGRPSRWTSAHILVFISFSFATGQFTFIYFATKPIISSGVFSRYHLYQQKQTQKRNHITKKMLLPQHNQHFYF